MSDILDFRNQVRYQQWAQGIKEYRESGLKLEAWCNMIGWTRNQYFYRLRRVRALALEQSLESGLIVKVPNALAEETSPDRIQKYDAPKSMVTMRSSAVIIEMDADVFKGNISEIIGAMKDA